MYIYIYIYLNTFVWDKNTKSRDGSYCVNYACFLSFSRPIFFIYHLLHIFIIMDVKFTDIYTYVFNYFSNMNTGSYKSAVTVHNCSP